MNLNKKQKEFQWRGIATFVISGLCTQWGAFAGQPPAMSQTLKGEAEIDNGDWRDNVLPRLQAGAQFSTELVPKNGPAIWVRVPKDKAGTWRIADRTYYQPGAPLKQSSGSQSITYGSQIDKSGTPWQKVLVPSVERFPTLTGAVYRIKFLNSYRVSNVETGPIGQTTDIVEITVENGSIAGLYRYTTETLITLDRYGTMSSYTTYKDDRSNKMIDDTAYRQAPLAVDPNTAEEFKSWLINSNQSDLVPVSN